MINFSKLAAVAKTISKPVPMPEVAADQLAQEKMTRRAALRKFGMVGGMAALSLLTIDDLARVSAKKLEEHEMTKGLAKDFKNAGVAMADSGGGGFSQGCQGDCLDICDCAFANQLAACGKQPKRSDYPLIPFLDWEAVYLFDLEKWNVCRIQAGSDYRDCTHNCP